LTVTGSGGGGGGGGGTGITNGGFENGFTGWTTTGTATIATSGCHGGSACLMLGSTVATNGDSTGTQTSFAAPAGTTGISLWFKESCPDSVNYDWATVTLTDDTSGTSESLLGRTCATNNWTHLTGAVVAGHSYTLTLLSHDDDYPADPTYTLFDDVALTSSVAPPEGIIDGDFSAGLTGWTASGAAVNDVTRTGGYAVLLGLFTATNGDSSVTQAFTVPSGKSQLSFWYAMTCPDSVIYDWSTVTLQNEATGAVSTVLPHTCATDSLWINVTAPVTAGTTYSLTLTSHDDDNPADPSNAAFTNVTLN
jgi:hypothetical protein